jgi:hypothetical protein
MDQTYSIPSKDSSRQRVDTARWPVLVRVPDVSAELPAAAKPMHRSAPVAELEYRFDPPQTRAAEPAVRVESRWRQQRRESAILPKSDPFAIPAQTFHQNLAPVVRFLMLVALFTIAGTIILLSRSEKRPTSSTQPRAFSQQSLEPVAAHGSVESIDSSFSDGGAHSTALPVAPGEETMPAAPAATADAVSQTVSESANPSGDVQVGEYAPNSEQVLSQFPTAEPPPAVAHLPGYILAAPSRQASNDDDQSSIH